MLDKKSTSTHPQSQRTFRCPSIPFYLKALLLTCASTVAYMSLRGSRFGENISSETNSNPIVTLGNAAVEASPTYFVADLTIFSLSIPSSESLINLEDASALTSQTSEEIERPGEADKKPDFLPQRHLLQASIQMGQELEPVVANPTPNHFIQIGDDYTYELEQVFPEDYFLVGASVPSWLKLNYEQVASYQENNANAFGVNVSNGTLFVTDERSGLQIFDIRNLASPILLSNYTVTGSSNNPIGIAVSGEVAFLAYMSDGLHILNISNLTSPRLLSNYKASDSPVYRLLVSDQMAFIACGPEGFQILNVSDPEDPKPLGRYKVKNVSPYTQVYRVVVSKNTAFLAYQCEGLHILDVSNLTAPKLLKIYPHPDESEIYGVAVSGDTLFVADFNAGLHILNVSDPKSPQVLKIYSNVKQAWDVMVLGNIAFVAGFSVELYILDVRNPSQPQLLGEIPAGKAPIYSITVSGNSLFMANGIAGVQIFDLRSGTLMGFTPPSVEEGHKWLISINAHALNGSCTTDAFLLTADNLPQLIQYTLTDQALSPGKPFTLALKMDRLFSTNISHLDFSLYQNDGSILPDWLEFIQKPKFLFRNDSYSATNDGHIIGAAISDKTVFMVTSYAGLKILDISDPIHPKPLGNTGKGNSPGARRVVVSGNTLLVLVSPVPSGSEGLLVFDVSDRAHPQKCDHPIGRTDQTQDVAAFGNRVFVANTTGGLSIWKFNDPRNPQFLGSYRVQDDYILRIAASTNIVFMAGYNVGLYTLNVSDPVHPKQLGTLPAGRGSIGDIAILGNTIFMVGKIMEDRGAGLLISDVSNPARPQILNYYPINSVDARMVTAANDMVFVSLGLAGLLILDVKNPMYPRQLNTYSPGNNGFVNSAVISGDTVFVADGNAGLLILNIRDWQFKIMANPTVGDAKNYYLNLTATDKIGASVSIPFTMRVEGPPKVNTPMPSKYAEVGNLFSFNIPPDTFTHPNFDPLIFNLSYADQQAELPKWLDFNKLSMTLSGTPGDQDKGIVRLRFIATDQRRRSNHTDFNLTVVSAPTPVLPQPLPLVQGRFFREWIPLEGIFDGGGQPFIYNLTVADNDKTVFDWLSYNFWSQLELRGRVPSSIAIGSLNLFVHAKTKSGYEARSPLRLSIEPNLPPELKEPISAKTATVGEKFDFVLPAGTFVGRNRDELSYTASLLGETNLPPWLTFVKESEKVWRFKGTPGGWDTNPFWSKTMTIQVTAYNPDRKSENTSFNLTVNGTSALGLMLKIATPLLSAYGLFRKRSVALNRLCYKRRQKPPRTLEAGQPFSLPLSTPSDKIGSIRVKTRHVPPKGCAGLLDCQRFFRPPIHYLKLPYDPLAEGMLPRWMEYKKVENTLEGILPFGTYEELMVCVKDRSGVIQEHFVLKIEGAGLDVESNKQTGLIHPKFNIQDDEAKDMRSGLLRS